MPDIDTTISNLNSALLDESAWSEDLARQITEQIERNPKDWNAIRKHWPELSALVEEFIEQWSDDPADKAS